MTTIGFIRHGSTHWNKEGRAQGNSDIPLDQDGLTQARLAAERLAKENWEIVYSSPLSRAKQTAEAIGQHIGIQQILFDDRLKEAYGGQIEGTTEEERIQRWGTSWRDLDLGIESFEDVTARGMEMIEEITKLHTNKKILVVSHGSFIRQLLIKLFPDLPAQALGNTSITRIKLSNHAWECELLNCTKHLEGSMKEA